MKVEYFPTKLSYLRTVSSRVIEEFVKRLDGCILG